MGDELGFQNMWFSIGATLAAVLVGSVLLSSAPEGVQGIYGMTCFFSGIALRHLLDGRKLRRLEREKVNLPR